MSEVLKIVLEWINEYWEKIDKIPDYQERIYRKEALLDFQHFIIHKIS